MTKVTIFIQKPGVKGNYTGKWDLPRNEELSYLTKLKGEKAAMEAFHITNCPSLTDRELAKLKNYNGPAISVGDMVKVEEEEGIREFLCDNLGWQERV